ncbi:hypothetical protein, partial [Nitrosomonas europaea]|uniref:hypothetical protein n=1 Tax=Nitrosomonas europaea TaxID=915 RepID=UPI00089D6291
IVHELQGKTLFDCSWLHSLKSWSLLKTRGDSLLMGQVKVVPTQKTMVKFFGYLNRSLLDVLLAPVIDGNQ